MATTTTLLLTITPWGYIISYIPHKGIYDSELEENMPDNCFVEEERGCPPFAAEESPVTADEGYPACFEKHTVRPDEAKKALLTRLKRIERQVRGLQGMVEKDAYCPDILIQVSAATNALNSFNKELLACHVKSCVSEDIKAGNDAAIDEFVHILQKLMK